MKITPKLMKLILLKVKNSTDPLTPTDLRIPGYSKSKVSDHVHILIITEHLKGILKEHTDGPLECEMIEGITERGQEYLIIADQITNEQTLLQYLNRRPPRDLPQLCPEILVTDDPGYDYPLQFFNLFILIEPDEEEWEPHPDSDEDNSDVQQPWDIHCEMLENEIDPDSETEIPNPAISLQTQTQILWLRNSFFNYYTEFAFDFASVIFQRDYQDFRLPENMIWYLDSVYQHHPEWKVAIVGGMFEDEVTTTANILHDIGFNTTILTRYCLSVNGFNQMQGNNITRLFPPDLLP